MEQTKTASLGKKLVASVSAVALAASMAFAGAGSAFALNLPNGIEGTTNSITIHKTASNTPSDKPHDGTEIQGFAGEPVQGAEFTLTKLKEDMVTKDTTADKVAGDLANYQEAAGTTVATGADGIAKFENLADGYYLLQETKVPSGFTASKPNIIQLPYFTNSQNDGDLMNAKNYLRNIHVYPKNVVESSVGDVNKELVAGDTVSPEVGSELTYRIDLTVPTDPDQLKGQDPNPFFKFTISDLLPLAADGSPVLDYKSIVMADNTMGNGSKLPGDAGFTSYTADQLAAMISGPTDSSTSPMPAPGATSGTEAGLGYGKDQADGSAWTWKNNGQGFVDGLTQGASMVHFYVTFEVNEKIKDLAPVQGGGSSALVNKVYSWSKDAQGNEGGNTDDDPSVNAVGLSFQKTGAMKNDQGQWVSDGKGLTGVGFQLCDENGNVISKGGVAQNKETGVNGNIGFTQLGEYEKANGVITTDLTANGAPYLKIAEAIESALAGNTATVDLQLNETKVVDGYLPIVNPVKLQMEFKAETKADGTKVVTNVVKEWDGKQYVAVSPDKIMQVMNFTEEQGGEGAPGITLPNTGGTGALLIVLAGLVLVIGSAAWYKRNQNRARMQDVA